METKQQGGSNKIGSPFSDPAVEKSNITVFEFPPQPHNTVKHHIVTSRIRKKKKLEPTFEVDPTTDSFDEEVIEIGPHQKPNRLRQDLNLKRKKSLEDLDTSHIPFENVLDIEDADLDDLEANSENLSSEMFNLRLKQHASLLLANETSSTQAEIILRDCYGTDIEQNPDTDFMLEYLINMDTFNFVLSRMENIPKEVKTNLNESVSAKYIEDWKAGAKAARAKANFVKVSTELENAIVNKSNIGVKRSFGKA